MTPYDLFLSHLGTQNRLSKERKWDNGPKWGLAVQGCSPWVVKNGGLKALMIHSHEEG